MEHVKLSEEAKRYTKFKLEFMRRNLEYRKDYEKLQEILEKKFQKSYDESTFLGSFEDKMQIPEYVDFCKKWKISDMFDPEMSYSDHIKEGNKSEENLVCIENEEEVEPFHFSEGIERRLFFTLNPESVIDGVIKVDGWDTERRELHWNYDLNLNVNDPICSTYGLSEKLKKTGKLTIEVDLNYSKNKLKRELERVIDEWKGRYEDRVKKKAFLEYCKEKRGQEEKYGEDEFLLFDLREDGTLDELKDEFKENYTKELSTKLKKYRQKNHFSHFDIYLKIWDLREKKKLSWNKIATELFPSDSNGIQTARNHHKAACKIVEKGVELYFK